jgi:hypothetical protein
MYNPMATPKIVENVVFYSKLTQTNNTIFKKDING